MYEYIIILYCIYINISNTEIVHIYILRICDAYTCIHTHLVLDISVVQTCVEHDNGERQNVAGIWGRERESEGERERGGGER